MCHGAIWILIGYFLKCMFGCGVSEGMKESYAFVELLLNSGGARDRE